MKVEMKSMIDRKVWRLVPLPKLKSVLGSRWVYNLKRDETGNIARFKARLVAQGYKQVKGESFDETFSPVVNFTVIRFFFSLLAVHLKWCNIQCDVKNAYLYAPLKREIYMQQPPGFVEQGKEHLVCRLDRALYGLHQSGRLWFFELNNVLLRLGFQRLRWCNCVYRYSNYIVLLVYVDDMVIFGKSLKQVNSMLNILKSKFDLKILGQTKKLLGVEFNYHRDHIEIHQSLYIDEIITRFKEYKFPVSSLPIAKGIKYSKDSCPVNDNEFTEMSKYPYRNVLGCLSFLANRTRPDISYAVNIFSQYQVNPGMVHWQGLLKLLGYVSYTRHYKLKLNCHDLQLSIFSDADYAANRNDMVSLGGQISFLGNSPISWRTFKQKSISLSTMESEFVAITEAAREMV